MTVTTAPSTSAPSDRRTRSTLRRLYFARFGFALAWAALFVATSSPVGIFAVVLLVLYPAFDVVAAVIDARTSTDGGRSNAALYVNVAISAAAAVGLAVVGDDVKGILLVWGLGRSPPAPFSWSSASCDGRWGRNCR